MLVAVKYVDHHTTMSSNVLRFKAVNVLSLGLLQTFSHRQCHCGARPPFLNRLTATHPFFPVRLMRGWVYFPGSFLFIFVKSTGGMCVMLLTPFFGGDEATGFTILLVRGQNITREGV